MEYVSWLSVFICLFLYRYTRLVVNLVSFWTFRPIPIPENPTLTTQDVTVILPSLDGEGDELESTVASILKNEPKELILVTIDGNLHKAESTIGKMPAAYHKRLRCMSVKQANKRRQMARAIPEVTTRIVVFADDDVTWPIKTLAWMLAPFEDPKYGGVVTCQRLRRAVSPNISQRLYNFLAALYLERRNFDCASTTHMDGGTPCMSGRTVAYRTDILQDKNFTSGFTDEKWWFGQYQLNADDDNFITRWLVSHGKETYMQYHTECEVLTTLEDNPKFLKQCLRWARSNWRSNLTSMFVEKHIWSQQPWSTYAVHLTTLAPPAIVGDLLLMGLLYQATAEWSVDSAAWAMRYLIAWMIFSKFIKLVTHFVRYPVDIFLWPVSVLFGYFHGAIKYYALATLSETTWGSRAGADASDSERMKPRPRTSDEVYDLNESYHEKCRLYDDTKIHHAYEMKRNATPPSCVQGTGVYLSPSVA